jgi:hypothetical protein
MISNHIDRSNKLPPEIILLLLPFLTRTGLSRLSKTCKLYRSLFLLPLFTKVHLSSNSSQKSFAEIFGIDVTLDWTDRVSVLLSTTKKVYKDLAVLGLPKYLDLQLGTLLNNYIPLIKLDEPLITIPKQPALKTLMVPYDRTINHRQKGGVYGLISLKSKSRYKDMNLLPCLQFSIGSFGSGNDISRFVRNFSLYKTDISDQILTCILINLPFLNSLKIQDCILISDKSCKAISGCSHLTKLSLIGLPRLTNSGLVWISKCLNLEYLCLKNTLEISEVGLKHVFYSCPFLKHLDLERLGVGNGFGIGKEIVPYLLAYAQSLCEIVLSGCMLDADALKMLCQKSKQIQKITVGYSTFRTRDLQTIKDMVTDWMGVEVCQVSRERMVISIVFKNLRQIVIR